MSSLLDNVEVKIACPKCGKQLKEKIGRLKREKHVKCVVCGRVAVNTDQLRKIEAKIETTISKEIAKIPRKITLKL